MIVDDLFLKQDTAYRNFTASLTPTLSKDRVIGVRVPILRIYAKEIFDTPEAQSFLQELPHIYYEENNLHAFLIERIEDRERLMQGLERFLPYIDNWATCDMLSPPLFKKQPPTLTEIDRWLASDKIYTVRFGVNALMKYYLDERFAPQCLTMVAAVKGEDYYIKMVVAWYFATALAKQWQATLPYVENKKLESWTHNKAIQKAIESRRISPEQKAYLRSLKWVKK